MVVDLGECSLTA